MAADESQDLIPDSGALFTFGNSKFADNHPSTFLLKNDKPAYIACGDEHTALVTENGKLYVFGSNNWGQLGLGPGNTINKPTCVKELKTEKVKFAACGRNHTLVSTVQGKIFSSGSNSEGQLGLGDLKERKSFHEISFFNTHYQIKQLSAGSNTSAALTEDGKLFMWGDNSEGQLGLGNGLTMHTPQQVNFGKPISWISCGYYHSAFVTQDGELYTFGEPENGKLGQPPELLAGHKVPQRVSGISGKVKMVSCGGGHTVAVTDKIYTFGLGQFGQLGHGTHIFETQLPKVVDAMKKNEVCHVACGENHTALITELFLTQLAELMLTPAKTGILLSGNLERLVNVITCPHVIRYRGLLYTFGDDRHGKLGLGGENFTNQFVPTFCSNFLKYTVQSVACGGCHMLVFATPRPKESKDTLKENYLTDTSFNGDNEMSASLHRTFSARHRRREKGYEQTQALSRTLPPLTNRPLNTSMAVTSNTIPPRLHKVRPPHIESPFRSEQQLRESPEDSVPKDDEDGQTKDLVKSFSAADSSDTESQEKSLGDTTDVLNMTHVMSLNPENQTLNFSPVQKRKEARASEESEEEEEDEEEEEQEEEEDNEEKDDPNSANENGTIITPQTTAETPVKAPKQEPLIEEDSKLVQDVKQKEGGNRTISPEADRNKTTLIEKTKKMSIFRRKSSSQKSLQESKDNADPVKANTVETQKESVKGNAKTIQRCSEEHLRHNLMY
uniref:X-linked retinitis pigmentosa GTPase regulator n=1 Tax=Leptobrachium leishanense TaxID=445787 RepID=A0A8C5M1L0_9ANUR